jgi:5-methylcytosine-specific restriction protein B
MDSTSINFDDITRDDIINAIAEYDKLKDANKLKTDRGWRDFILFYNSKEYPHKYIVGIAYGLKHNKEPLVSSKYRSTTGSPSAQICVEDNGFELFNDKDYKEYLQKNHDNKNTRDTYYSDLKRDIKILQQIDDLKEKKLSEIFDAVTKGEITEEQFNQAKNNLNYGDKQLFSNLKYLINLYQEAISSANKHNNKKHNNNKSIILANNKKNNLPSPLNQILYGPPGTGKTYHTINKALKIIDPTAPKDREEAKKRFDELKANGQIEFITFHQSYGYEEFVEGIKAIPKGKEGNDTDEMIYDVVDGIFKRLSDIAKINFEKSTLKTEDELQSELSIDELLKSFNEYLNTFFEDGKEFELKGKATIKAINSQGGYELGGSVSTATLSPKIIKRDYKNFKDGSINTQYDIAPTRESKQNSIGNSNYYFALLEQLKNFEEKDENSIQQIKIEKEELKNYVLIIDEINRGNISKIFGELITLIEDTKRAGCDEEVEITLPYSGEKFSVPKNLYIIGTMNTADRSIALMDTALRRRFEFVEMMPEPKLLENINIDKINLKVLLSKINQRIEYLYDRDHTIGHAYFLDVKNKNDLDSVMKNKIIPLLQEYFYDDWEKIQMVLGKGFIEKKEIEANIFKYQIEDYLEENKFIFSIKDDFDYSEI